MKIATISELKDVIEKLTTQIDTPSTTVSTKMDATEINDFFESVESAFNTLYEKLRLLQDVHDFAKAYVQKVYDRTTKELNTVKLDSDIANQEYRNSKARACVGVFQNSGAVRDRDGSALYQADISDSVVIPGNATIETADLTSAAVYSTDLCYRRNTLPASNYKSFYVLEDAMENAPQEKITFFLPAPVMLNHMDLAAFNSDVESIKLTCSNGDIIDVPVGGTTFATRSIMAIEVTLRANKRDKVNAKVSDKASTFITTDNQAVTEILDNVWDTYTAQKGDITHVLH